MFKSSDGSTKFSFNRLISNAIPNIASAPIDTELSPTELDSLFMHQLGEPDPLLLSAQAFLNSGITSSPKVSGSIHKALVKNNVLSTTSPVVNTSAIGKNFTHDLAMITSHAQKKVINLLFFWEEEGQRWKKLIGEQEELKVVIEAEKSGGGEVGSYEKRLVEVEGLMRLRPSLRGEGTREREDLPAYAEGRH
jgi:hypothetical protein